MGNIHESNLGFRKHLLENVKNLAIISFRKYFKIFMKIGECVNILDPHPHPNPKIPTRTLTLTLGPEPDELPFAFDQEKWGHV